MWKYVVAGLLGLFFWSGLFFHLGMEYNAIRCSEYALGFHSFKDRNPWVVHEVGSGFFGDKILCEGEVIFTLREIN